jgi:uncharacterized protein (DUF924 family)
MAQPDPRIDDVLTFWFEETSPEQWFTSDPAFDEEIHKRFGTLHAEACAGGLERWMETPEGALALIILLDQFSRNMFRGKGEAFAQDAMARGLADKAIEAGHDMATPAERRAFFYMPFMHAEDLDAQEKCIALVRERLGEDSTNLPHAKWHRDVIAEFGRFPFRNIALGRPSTREEIAFLNRENVPG